MPTVSGEAWVTLATTDRYALGALVVAGSLRDAGTTRSKVVMITDGVSPRMRTALSSMYDLLFDVTSMDSGDAAHLALLQRPDLGVTFTKLHCWRLIQFSKCVFLDADTIVLQNCDELFSREEFSAAPDAGWPDCFNSGVFVYKPSLQTFSDLVRMAETEGSFDGGDQGLLNSFFSDWGTKDIAKHLSFTYNMTATAMYTYLPALKRFGKSIKILHFIGRNKPWMASLNAHGEPYASPGEEGSLEHLKKWWLVFHSHVHDLLNDGAEGELPACLPQLMQMTSISVGQPSGQQQPQQQPQGAAAEAVEPSDNREAWEVGQMDFRGTAAFDNILKRIETTLSTPSSPSHQ